jgi:hypothetical protein
MKKLTIEWLHLDVETDGEATTCVRCAGTGEALADVVEALAHECRPTAVEISFKETKLAPSEVSRSNLVLVNGVPIEDVLPGASSSQNACQSCCELIGRETDCRTVEYGGETYETIPAALIRQAACAVAGCC